MRFGKKSRNLAATSRRFLGERPQEEKPTAGVAVETLESTEDEENTMTPPPPEESMVAGDPTQRLLTALGRFQRQVARAEEGAPQEAWCDECMNQLITGIEIALNEDWSDVKEALTDAARILQTYEDAGRADRCIRFLKDSYEILCLMVGDLIVGNVRSGVMKKWQERYERVLDELAEAGLTLVDDDSPSPERAPEKTAPAADQAGDDFDELLDGEGGTPDSIFDSEPTGRAFSTTPGDPFAPLDPGMEADKSPFEGTASLRQAPASAADLPSLDELLGRPVSPDDDLDDGPAPELTSDFTAEDAHAGETLLLDESEPESGLDSDGVTPEEEDWAQGHAETTEEEADQSAESEPMEEPVLEEGPASLEDAEDLMEETEPSPAPAAVVAAAPSAAPEPEPEPGTPEALLRTAQRAMAAGNVADAKVFALQLAANMARLEADQVQARISLIEKDIEANSDAVTAGELAVNEAEERVRHLEEDVSRCQRELEDKGNQINSIREEVASVEGTVDDLNRQIADLEARRDAEAERLAGCQASLEDNLNEEGRMKAELESLQEEETGSRENLDGARERVRSLQESGSGHAAALESTQKELSKRQKAVEDIENTIRHVSGAADEEDAPTETAGDAAEQAPQPAAVPEQTELPTDAPEESSGDSGNGAGEDGGAEHSAE